MTDLAYDQELYSWLKRVKLDKHYSNFLNNEVHFDDLQYLDESILKDLGINKIGDRLKLNIEIQKLKDESLIKLVKIDQLFKEINENSKLKINKLQKLDLDSISSSNSNTNSNSPLPNFNLLDPPSPQKKSIVSFILQNGSTVKINVNGCFNANSIKKKLIKFLDLPNKDPNLYNVYLTNISGSLHMLFDVELVTICHSLDRIEKNRMLFCPTDQTPSEVAIEVSKKYISLEPKSKNQTSGSFINDTEHQSNYTNDNHKINENNSNNINRSKFRNIFGQRPSSQLISTNLSQYFPETNQSNLQKTIRNSVRFSILNKSHSRQSTIGDFLVDNKTKRLSTIGTLDSLNLQSSLETEKQRFSIASSIDEENSVTDKIELFSIDSDDDNDEADTIQNELLSSSSTSNNANLISGPANWLKGARIGSGSFGTVYLGMNSITGELMAVKQVELKPFYDAQTNGTENNNDNNVKNDSRSNGNNNNKDNDNNNNNNHISESGKSNGKKNINNINNNNNNNNNQIHQRIVEALQHEMKLLSELHHENIVTYLGSSSDESYLNIFLEYVPGGSLSTMITNYGPFEEPLVRNFTRQILIGLNYLHSKDIIHRDIKGANILIDIKGEVKISDFGISKKLNPSIDKDKRASLQGSVYWMAPEVVKQIVTTTKADIWSVGCLIIEMFTGKHPFPNFSQMQAIFKIGTHNTPEIPSWCTNDAKSFLKKTFILDYKMRPSAKELLNDNFLENLIIEASSTSFIEIEVSIDLSIDWLSLSSDKESFLELFND
ncbi:hypothetical protein WICMUC_005541 [Wickerhamomyces mucosus]|uniref:mitogen-activated protein kinase kinase kinase n=1 Tax=Wickerhamomyces mucosus TaxID=1378264 RepID=A0A9P8T5V0_9ASCO|nr:hypothetical protein WICMUC_005541 [Wickerhamomyces mucosus]